MIAESYYWRNELLKRAESLKKNKYFNRRWIDSQYGNLEKNVMIGFYIIRKLIESQKLTNKLVSTNLNGLKYPTSKNGITIFNNHRIEEFYDLENPQKAKFKLDFLINQFIHSFIFKPIVSLNGKNGKIDPLKTAESDHLKLCLPKSKKLSVGNGV